MSETQTTMKLLAQAHDALRRVVVSGVRNSAPLVRRCGELADELEGAKLQPVAEHLRAVAAAGDEGAPVAAVFRALAAVRHARVWLAKPIRADAASPQ